MHKKSVKREDVVIADSIRRLFADEFVLYSKMRIARWNVEGPDFYIKYNLFKELYMRSENAMSKIGRQLFSTGEPLPGSIPELLSLTELRETLTNKRDSKALATMMLVDIQLIMNSLAAIKDELGFSLYYWDTGSFIDELSDMHQEMISMLTEHSAGS